MTMDACVNAKIGYRLILSDKYGLHCHEGSDLVYILSLIERDIEEAGFDCKKKEEGCGCSDNSNVSYNLSRCNEDLLIDDNPCTTC